MGTASIGVDLHRTGLVIRVVDRRKSAPPGDGLATKASTPAPLVSFSATRFPAAGSPPAGVRHRRLVARVDDGPVAHAAWARVSRHPMRARLSIHA